MQLNIVTYRTVFDHEQKTQWNYSIDVAMVFARLILPIRMYGNKTASYSIEWILVDTAHFIDDKQANKTEPKEKKNAVAILYRAHPQHNRFVHR